MVRQRYPRARALLVGGGYEHDALVARTQQLGLGDIITFTGHRPDARALMRAVDLVVLPSLQEGLPYVLVEAMDAGRPVVATRIPGTCEAVVRGYSSRQPTLRHWPTGSPRS